MPRYKYTLIGEDGSPKTGEIDAINPENAKRELQQNGSFVTKIYAADASFSLAHLSTLSLKDILAIEIGGGRISTAELIAFNRQFATLVQAGIPLVQALDVLQDQLASVPLKRICQKMMRDIKEGQTLSHSLMAHRALFGDFYINMVKSAEKTGKLGHILEDLATFSEKRQELMGSIRGALTYPAIMLVVGLGVVAFLLTSVVPNITTMFTSSGNALPGITQMMLSISDFLKNDGIILIATLAGLTLALNISIQRSPKMRERYHQAILITPLVKFFAVKTAHSRFTTTLAALLSAGVPMVEALAIAKDVTPFIPFKKAIESMETAVREGMPLHKAMAETGKFPSLMVNMAGIGEKSGRLAEMLTRTGTALQKDLEQQLAGISRLLQPLLILMMGALIAFVMGAVLVPIFELNSIIN